MAFEDVAKSLGLSEEVIKTIPEDLRTDKSLEPIKDLTGLMTSFRDGQKMIGTSIRIPKEDAKPEEINAFYNKLGRPETPDKYEIVLPYPEYVDWNKDRINSFAARAHAVGYTPKQIQTAIDWYGEVLAQEIQAKKTSFEAAQNALKGEWGAAYDRNLALAKRVRDLYGGEELKEFFRDDPSGNDPRVIRFLAKLGADLEEGDFLGGPGESGGLTPDEAKTKITAIMNNPEDIYHAKFKGRPGHEERVKEVESLYAIAYNRV